MFMEKLHGSSFCNDDIILFVVKHLQLCRSRKNSESFPLEYLAYTVTEMVLVHVCFLHCLPFAWRSVMESSRWYPLS